MKRSVLITRPYPDAEDFAQAVQGLGAKVVLDPLLQPVYFSANIVYVPQGIIATSAHAFSAPAPDHWAQLPVVVMGQNSRIAAHASGYQNITSANGSFEALLQLADKIFSPGTEILYLRGETVRHQMQERLPHHAISEQIVYAMQPATALHEATVQALSNNEIGVVTLFSPRTAATFAELLAAQGLSEHAAGIKALCLSAAVLDSVRTLPWQTTEIAPYPDRDGMLAVLQLWMDQAHD